MPRALVAWQPPCSSIVNRMTGYVPFPMVLKALLSDTTVARKFSEVKVRRRLILDARCSFVLSEAAMLQSHP